MKGNSQKPQASLIDRLSNRRALILLGGLSLWLVLAAILGGVYFSRLRSARRERLAAPPSMKELARQFPQIKDILLDEKLDSVYKQFLVAYQEGGEEAAYELAKMRGILNEKNEIRLTLELDSTDTASLQAGLEAAGIRVTAASGNLIDIAIPLVLLEASLESDEPGQLFMQISGLEHIRRLRFPAKAMGDDVLGKEIIESLPLINADDWHAAGITGKGVKIGVLDVGFDKYKALLGSELPANVITRSGIDGLEIDKTEITHGTSVAEVIHDIAPDAQLYLTNYGTPAEMMQSVEWLVDQGVDIISNSTNHVFGPNDGSGILAQMVDDVVSKGIVWVNSGGNYRQEHYRGEFQDQNQDGWHEFYQDDDMMAFYPYGDASLTLFWNDWKNTSQDFDLYVYDDSGEVIASSTNEQSGANSSPVEELYYDFPDEGPYYIAIYASNANRRVIFNFFIRHGDLEYYTEGYSGGTPADSRSSISVGAVDWSEDQVEDYSSMGPTEDGRLKPDMSAPTNVYSVAKGESFGGTSAAAPHVSGAVALILQAYPDLTPQQVREFLYKRAVDLGAYGPDYEYGNGRLYLGDPLEPETVSPAPTLTQVALAPAPPPTATRKPQATRTTTSTRTATTSPTSTPKTSGSSQGALSLLATVGLLGCVIVPGLLGAAGIGLVAIIWQRSRGVGAGGQSVLPARSWEVPASPVSKSGVSSRSTVQLICPNCNRPNKPSAHFCFACGYDFIAMRARETPTPASFTPAPAFCRGCGQLLRKDSKFCPRCGSRIVG